MTDFIKVKATKTDSKVALWEKHLDHPNGEVFVTGNGKVMKVANTVAVRDAIRRGALVEVQPEKASAPVEPEQPPVEPVPAETPTTETPSAERVKPAKR